MSMQPSFRSMMYATFALAILPALVACSSGNDGQEGVENRVKPVAVFEQPAHATEAGAEGDAAVTAGETASEDAAAAVEPVAAAEAVAPVAVAAGRDGATVYNQVCRTCHEVGVAGAPKKGDKAAWAPRIATGKEALYTSALKGKGAMASKGGNPSLSDDEVKGAVDYLVSLAQ
ncbi:cytochrome c-related lipoprotein [Betaproteobacteria bacterium]|nr:cytochrome c-related lipoprotein [Betaproteobacteria bacterium]